MVDIPSKGLQRKRGFFNLNGDTERQMQDLEQDTDDSLRSLSDQIDRLRTETRESSEDTNAEVKRVAEDSGSQSASIADLQSQLDELKARSKLPNAVFRFANNSGETYLNGDPIRMENVSFDQDPQGIELVPFGLSQDSAIILPSPGLYTIQAQIVVERLSSANPSSAVISLKRYTTPGASQQEFSAFRGTRYSSAQSDEINVKMSFTTLFTDRLYLAFTNASSSTIRMRDTDDDAQAIWVSRIGDAP